MGPAPDLFRQGSIYRYAICAPRTHHVTRETNRTGSAIYRAFYFAVQTIYFLNVLSRSKNYSGNRKYVYTIPLHKLFLVRDDLRVILNYYQMKSFEFPTYQKENKSRQINVLKITCFTNKENN